MYRRKRQQPKDSPTIAMGKAKELIAKKNFDKAMAKLFETISYRHRAQFDQTYEDAMKMYIKIGVQTLKSCKEGFLHYRSLVQQNHPQSLERMISHLITSIEKVGAAEVLTLTDATTGIISDIQYDNRVLKYQWECYQTVLMILRNNGKLNNIFRILVLKCIKFCNSLTRTIEFKKLCDTIRRRFIYVEYNQHFDYALKINSTETLNSMMDIRLNLLNCALSMNLYQESFKCTKDICRNIIQRSIDLKKNIDPLLYSKFYEKLASVFWLCNKYLLHSYSIYESYKKLKLYIDNKISKKQKQKNERELLIIKLNKLLITSLLSTLIVPSKESGNNNNINDKNIQSLYQLFNDFFHNNNNVLKNRKPSKSSLLHFIMNDINNEILVNNNNNKIIYQNCQNLYNLFYCNTNGNGNTTGTSTSTSTSPLIFIKKFNNIINLLKTENDIDIFFYMDKIYEIGIITLLHKLSFVYKSISYKRLNYLLLPWTDDKLHKLNNNMMERIITSSVISGATSLRISHSFCIIYFLDNNSSFESFQYRNSIVLLSSSLKKFTYNYKMNNVFNNNNNNNHRNNVFNQIRHELDAEHNHIDSRLKTIFIVKKKRNYLNKKQIKLQKLNEIKRINQRKLIEKEEEIKIKNSRIISEKKQKELNLRKEIIREHTQKWKEFNIKNVNKLTINQNKFKINKNIIKKVKVTNHITPKNAQNINNKSYIRIMKIQNEEKELKKQIEKQIEKSRTNIYLDLNKFNMEDTQFKMKYLEKKRKKKDKLILKMEKIEYDYLCRSYRKYLLNKIRENINKNNSNNSNISIQYKIFKKETKENKKEFNKKLIKKNRLIYIKNTYLNQFNDIIHNYYKLNQSKNQSKNKNININQSKNQLKNKNINVNQSKNNKNNNINNNQSKNQSKNNNNNNNQSINKQKKNNKFVPRRISSDNVKITSNNNNNNNNNKQQSSKPKPKPKTFAEKIKFKRNQQNNPSSFGDKFANDNNNMNRRSNNNNNNNNTSFGSNRFNNRNDDNNNNNSSFRNNNSRFNRNNNNNNNSNNNSSIRPSK